MITRCRSTCSPVENRVGNADCVPSRIFSVDRETEGRLSAAADAPGPPGGGLRGRYTHPRPHQPHLGRQNQVHIMFWKIRALFFCSSFLVRKKRKGRTTRVLGSNLTSGDAVESKWRQMKQYCTKYIICRTALLRGRYTHPRPHQPHLGRQNQVHIFFWKIRALFFCSSFPC